MRLYRYRISRTLRYVMGSLSRTGLGKSLRRRRLRRRIERNLDGTGKYEVQRRYAVPSHDEAGEAGGELKKPIDLREWDEEYLARLPKGRASSGRVVRSLLGFYLVLVVGVLGFVAYKRDMAAPVMGRLSGDMAKGAAAIEENLNLDLSLSKHLLERAIPGLRRPEPKVTKELVLSAMSRAVKQSLPSITGVDLRSPSSIIDSQIASLDASRIKVRKPAKPADSRKKIETPAEKAGLPAESLGEKTETVPEAPNVSGEPEKGSNTGNEAADTGAKTDEARQTVSEKAESGQSDSGTPAVQINLSQIVSPDKSGSNAIFGTKPLVAIYHSHASETYDKENGHYIWESVKPDKNSGEYLWGTARGVVTVGTELAVTLKQKYGIVSVHSKKVHDYPVFRDAYKNTLGTIETILKDNPSVEMVFDIHRDGLAETDSTCTINGKKAARVFIVVTSDKFGLPHPNWRQNYAFALALNNRINQMYPGLSRGVNLRDDSRWNQHVHKRAVILEVGSNKNTTDQALETARLLADPIADMLREIRNS